MKKLFILLLLVLSSGIMSENRQKFTETAQGYDNYVVLTDASYATADYELIAVVGEVNQALRYSFAFTSDVPHEYQIAIQTGTDSFSASENKRGDVMIFGVDLKEDIKITILHQTMEIKTLVVKKYTLAEYRALAPKINGNGSGIPKDRIRFAKPKSAIFILSLVFMAIILVTIVIISLMYALKKGIFAKIKSDAAENDFIFPNPEKRANREIFVKSKVSDIDAEKKPEEQKEVKKEEPPAPKVEVYKKLHDEEEEFDISQKLIAKGLSVDYQNMGVDEKNKVMLALMQMRDLHEITAAEYQSEVIKLWM